MANQEITIKGRLTAVQMEKPKEDHTGSVLGAYKLTIDSPAPKPPRRPQMAGYWSNTYGSSPPPATPPKKAGKREEWEREVDSGAPPATNVHGPA